MRMRLFLLLLLHFSPHRHRWLPQLVRGWSFPLGDDMDSISLAIDREACRAGSSPHVREALGIASKKLLDSTVALSAAEIGPTLLSAKKLSFLRLDYGIFRGTSALRREPALERDDSGDNDNRNRTDELLRLHGEIPKACLALLLLLEGRGDEAHEVVLGVTVENYRQAEHAATHPPSNWSVLHPLSDDDDMVHSIIHRWEGERVGEGNHTGWENALYWACGGPKALDGPDAAAHPVRRALAAIVAERAPRVARCGVVVSAPPIPEPSCQRRHQILADGGSHRIVSVPPGCWDPIEFIKLKRRLSLLPSSLRQGPTTSSESDNDDDACWQEVCAVECLEISLLIRCTLLRQAGLTYQEIFAELLSHGNERE